MLEIMNESVAVAVMTALSLLGSVSFLLIIVGLFKPTLVIWKPSLQTRKGVVLVWGAIWFISSIGTFVVAAIAGSNLPDTETAPVASRDYYVGSKGANVRSCPQVSCAVIDTLIANAIVTSDYQSLAEAPDWIPIAVTSTIT